MTGLIELLTVERDRLWERVKELERVRDAAAGMVERWTTRATAAEERARALCDYVHHVDGCEAWFDGANGKPCTCGLAPLLEKP